MVNENNKDNFIFLSKRQFIYNYYYQDSLGNKYACEIYKDSFALKYKIYSGRLDDWEEADSNQVDKIGLYVYYGKNNGNYNQDETVIKYDYFNLFKQKGFLRERTTVTENKQELFLHPNRTLCFNSIYVCPYPEIQQPLVVGNTWQRSLTHSSIVLEGLVASGYNELGGILNFEFEVTDFLKVKTPFKKLECYKIVAKDSDGSAKNGYAEFYFNENYGFVKQVYFDGFKNMHLIIELETIIDQK